jgi:tight adherence protein B
VTLAAALCLGAFAALVVGHLLGVPVAPRRWRRTRPEISAAQLWLTQAGVALSPRQFVGGSAVIGFVAFTVGALVTGAALVALVPAVVAALLPRTYFGRQRVVRLREIQSAWPDGLRDLAASISAGHSLTQALINLADTGPAALREAFVRFPLLARMLGTVPALEIVKEELADPTSDRVIEVLILASERGGAIVKQIIEDLVVATTKDVKVLDEVESEGLEMKINARAVLVMPWLVLIALTVRAGPFRDFYRSGGGFVVVLVGAGLSGLGALWIGRLGRQPGEQRVFGSSASPVVSP